MLTVELKLNGRLIGHAKLVNLTDLADISDYALEWSEDGNPDFPLMQGRTVITGHRRKLGAWALVAKAAAAILGQMVRQTEGKG